MIKGIFFDVDGTLIPYGGNLLPDGLRADLLALRAQGVKLFLATGRGKRDLEATGMLRDVTFDAYLTMNGHRCYDERGLYRNKAIDRADVAAACRILRENPGLFAVMETDQGNFLNRMEDSLLPLFEDIHTPVYPVRAPEAALEEDVYQFVPFLLPGEEEIFLSAMPHCMGTRWHPKAIDIIPVGGGKADGIQATLERFGLAREEVMAFGDGDNDRSMLTIAGIGVAMGNADDHVKAAADYVTDSVYDGGVSSALRHFGLLPEKTV